MNKPILEAQGIRLRDVQQEDITLRLSYGINPVFAKMIGLPDEKVGEMTDEQAQHWYERAKQHPCKWVIEYQNKMIGTVSLRPEPIDNKGRFAIEIYDEEMYGKGIGGVTTSLVLQYAFNEMKYHKVYLRVLDYNTRAIHLYKKLGFVEEGRDREGAFINGQYHTDIYMGFLASEYRIRG